MEGRQASELDEKAGKAPAKKKNGLNFGWFSLPASTEVKVGQSAAAKPDDIPLETFHAAGSQGEPDAYDNYYGRQNSDTADGRSSKALGGGDRPEGGGRGETPLADLPKQGPEDVISSQDVAGPSAAVECNNYNDNVVVNWPLSSVALEQAQRLQASRRLGSQTRSSSARAADPSPSSQVPPTPLPPISWQGYNHHQQDGGRPTFKSWRDEWHSSHSHPAGSQPPHPDDCNNNNSDNDDKSLVDGDSDSDCDVRKQIAGQGLHLEPEFGDKTDNHHQISGTPESDGLSRTRTNNKTERLKIVAKGFKLPTKNVTKPVYESIPPVEEPSLAPKKTSIVTSAKSFLKLSCWSGEKGSKVKLLTYRKLTEEENSDLKVNGQKQTHGGQEIKVNTDEDKF